ncbi:MAG TPA: DedA family protein [Lichenihabitans sp.]|nr:DedA family protein [Lichenihabitans sp.]
MHLLDVHALHHFIEAYGYLAVLCVVALESSGLPLPGEAMLVGAAVYAGDTHALSILGLVAAAAGGAIVGDNIGFLVGREVGVPLLKRFGPRIGLDRDKLKLAQYLFRRQGGKIVFFGRFIAVLRAFAALLAGANRYPWNRFLVFNATGGILWATLYGTAAYLFGRSIHRIVGPVGIALAIVALIAAVFGWFFFKSHKAALQAEAERAIPD